jgi:hypothetical protein
MAHVAQVESDENPQPALNFPRPHEVALHAAQWASAFCPQSTLYEPVGHDVTFEHLLHSIGPVRNDPLLHAKSQPPVQTWSPWGAGHRRHCASAMLEHVARYCPAVHCGLKHGAHVNSEAM